MSTCMHMASGARGDDSSTWTWPPFHTWKVRGHPGPSWPHLGRYVAIRAHLGRYVTPLLGTIRARWAYRGRSGALSRRFRGATLPASSRWVLNPTRIRVWGTALGTSETPRKPLPEALPSGLSRARPRSNARVGASETTPGGSPQWPVVRTPTLQRTRERKNAVKRTVLRSKTQKHCKTRGFGIDRPTKVVRRPMFLCTRVNRRRTKVLRARHSSGYAM